VLIKAPWQPDVVLVAHAWLKDNPDTESVDPQPALKLRSFDAPVFIFLNKEYTNLADKLEYIAQAGARGVFTHHHDASLYQAKTGTPTYFMPFAVNHHRFQPTTGPDTVDLMFTGILRNPTLPETQRDTRVKIQKELFAGVGQVRLWKRRKARNLALFWSARASTLTEHRLNVLLHGARRLTADDYVKTLDVAKICLNTLSPLDLVSTRYFEAMAMKSLVLCPTSERYKGLFNVGEHVVTFMEKPGKFLETLRKILADEGRRARIVEDAFSHTMRSHTWERRVREISYIMNEHL